MAIEASYVALCLIGGTASLAAICITALLLIWNKRKVNAVIRAWITAERELAAAHESGHAIVTWKVFGSDSLLGISIEDTSRGGYLRFISTTDEYAKRITIYVAGQVGQELMQRSLRYGGQDDYERARATARQYGIKDHAEVEALIKNCEVDAQRIIEQNWDLMQALFKEVIQHTRLSGDQMRHILDHREQDTENRARQPVATC